MCGHAPLSRCVSLSSRLLLFGLSLLFQEAREVPLLTLRIRTRKHYITIKDILQAIEYIYYTDLASLTLVPPSKCLFLCFRMLPRVEDPRSVFIFFFYHRCVNSTCQFLLQPYIQIKAGKCAMEHQAGSSNNYFVTPILKKGSLNLVKGTLPSLWASIIHPMNNTHSPKYF